MSHIVPNKTFPGVINPDSASKRASRYQRPSRPIPMILTERDEKIIVRCWEDKILSTSNIHMLFFGARARCIHRLRILYSNHYLDRYFVPVLGPYRGATEALYTIGSKGNHIVSLRLNQGQNYVGLKRREFNTRMESPSFLLTFRHLRTVNHTRIMFEKAFEDVPDWQLLRWIPERLIEDQFTITQDGEVRKSKIRGDGFFQYQHTAIGKNYSAFTECDFGTMSKKQIIAKVQRYLHYFQTEAPQLKYGTQWFRVLMITTTPRRAQELWQTISSLTQSIFWLTSFEEMKKSQWLKRNIWRRSGHEGTHPLIY